MGETHGISLRKRIRINLVAAMNQANINQVQLAKKLGISKGTVNNWARGNNSPDVDMVPKICKVLSIPILDLYSPTTLESQKNIKKSPMVTDLFLREAGVAQPLEEMLERSSIHCAVYDGTRANPLYPVPRLMDRSELEIFYERAADWS